MEIRKTFSLEKALKFGLSAFQYHLPLLLLVSAIGIGSRLLYDLGVRIISSAYNIPIPLPKGFSFSSEQMAGLMLIFLLGLCFIAVVFVITMGWLRIGLDLHDNNKSSVRRLFLPLRILARGLGGSILFLMILIAYILLVGVVLFVFAAIAKVIGIVSFLIPIFGFLALIPLMMLFIKYHFVDLAIVDTGCGSVEGLRKSAHLTHNQKLPLFGAILAMLGISIAVLLPVFLLSTIFGKLGALIGLIVTVLTQTVVMYVIFLARISIYRQLQKVQEETAVLPFD